LNDDWKFWLALAVMAPTVAAIAGKSGTALSLVSRLE
jgi:hypothetical protein